ncbi:MAG: low affinity iron permease family protein [Acidimicrobiaceae bacterium]|nr:low affinity iron permease family protein [Acidimicrobiaceae bacterium]
MKWPRPQRRISRILHWIGELTSRTSAAAVALTAVLVFGLALAINGFPPNWLTGFAAVAAAVTLVMLFVIQHTQSRHQLALQLKLDELIRTSPSANNQLVRIEAADVDELDERTRDQQALHESLRDGDVLEVIEYPRPGTS